jgi:hypothetical protein
MVLKCNRNIFKDESGDAIFIAAKGVTSYFKIILLHKTGKINYFIHIIIYNILDKNMI